MYRKYTDSKKRLRNKDSGFLQATLTKKIVPSDTEKKEKLDAQIRDMIKEEFYDVLKKSNILDDDKSKIKIFIEKYIKKEQYFFVEREDQEDFVNGIMNDLFGLSVIESLRDDPAVQEIWVIGDKGVFYEKSGKRHQSNLKFKNNTKIISVINKILAEINRKVDESNPVAEGRLQDGSRISVTIPPVALHGPELNIRKFKEEIFTLADYVKWNSCSQSMRKFLQLAVQAKLNILVSGGTGSGKTTLLNALSYEIPQIDSLEHIITIEDAAELKIFQPFVSSWETKNKNAEGVGDIGASPLVAHSLRNAPDRIIIGEIRDKVAFEVLQTANTGHEGTMSTIHANNSKLAVKRFGDLASESDSTTSEEAQENFVDTFDLILSVKKIPGKQTSRKIVQITWCAGYGDTGAQRLGINSKDSQEQKAYLQDLFHYDQKNDNFVCDGVVPKQLIAKATKENIIISPSLFIKTKNNEVIK